MSEENKTPEGEQTPATFTQEQVEAMIADATKGLKAKTDELLSETKAAKAAREAAEVKAQQEAEEAARKAGDTEALEKSWQEKLAKIEAAKDDEAKQLRATVESLTVGQNAARMASELAVQGSASVLERLIAPRLGYEMKDGQARVIVRDENGQPSALTVDELKAEIAADPAYAPLIAASKASGGGAAHANGGAGSKKPDEMSAQDRAALLRRNPDEFYKLFPQAKLR